MIAADAPPREAERLAALRSYSLLDSPVEEAFDAITRLAGAICGTPIALISLIDGDRQWFKSSHGLDGVRETARDVAFCGHAIHGNELMEVPDALADRRFHDNPLVASAPHIRFYAGMPLTDSDGFALGTLCVIDRTPRTLAPPQRAALADLARVVVRLFESRRRDAQAVQLSRSLEMAGMSVLTIDLATRAVRDANDVACRTAGRSRGDLVGRPFAELLALGIGDFAEAADALLRGDADRAYISATLARPDGDGPAVDILLRHGGEAENPAAVAVMQDVSHLRAVESALRESDRTLRSLAQNIPAAIAYWDAGEHNRFANARLCELLGCEAAAMRGHSMRDLVGEAPYQAMRVHVAAALSGQRQQFEHEAAMPDGTRRIWQTTFVPDVEDGVVRGFFAHSADITALKDIEEALRRSEQTAARESERAHRANAAKSAFLANMSHELRTPLNAVIGFSQMLLVETGSNLSESQREYCKLIESGGQHLLALINDILELSAIESDRIELQVATIDMEALLAKVSMMMEPLAERMKISLSVEGWEAPAARGDELRLSQVLINLVSNAIKYNRPGGTVRVDVAATDDRVRFSVADTGRGIPPEKQPALFQAFSRLGAERSGIEGTGIGLIIAKRLVEAMEGTIGFASAQGVGSTFWVELPRAAAAAAPEAPQADAAPAETPAAPHCVLYVEDDPLNLRLVERLIATVPNATMLSTADPHAAIDIARLRRPDVIVLDINLPDMDGYTLLARLSALAETADTPVLAFSAAAMPEDIERGRTAGFDAYLTKPIDVHRFLAAIRGALDRASARRSAA